MMAPSNDGPTVTMGQPEKSQEQTRITAGAGVEAVALQTAIIATMMTEAVVIVRTVVVPIGEAVIVMTAVVSTDGVSAGTVDLREVHLLQ